MASSMSQSCRLTFLNASTSSASANRSSRWCRRTACKAASSRRTLAAWTGLAIRSDLISKMVILSISSPTETGTRISSGVELVIALPAPLVRWSPLSDCHAAKYADSKNVEPTLGKIEEMRIEQRAYDILRDDQEAEPGDQSAA